MVSDFVSDFCGQHWHALATTEAAHVLQSDGKHGLTAAEAAKRLERFGPNQLPTAPLPSLLQKLWEQISDFTVVALIIAAAIALALGLVSPPIGASLIERFGDGGAILLIVVLNAVLGLIQNRRAERSLEALANLHAPSAKVVREGTPQVLPAAALVPGDLIVVEAGDLVPADARLLSTFSLELEEAALTGESVPIEKSNATLSEEEVPLAERRNMIFLGTRVSRGRGRAMVTATARDTELGRIAGMLARVEPEATPLEDDLERFGKRVVIGCVAVSALVFAAGFFFSHAPVRELFLVAVALAVAAIPEGLPAVTTIVLALGTTRMAKRQALVRRLPAVETLGCTQFICTDKTGTLTQNRMRARRIAIGLDEHEIDEVNKNDVDARLLIDAAAYSIGAHLSTAPDGSVSAQGDPTDGALLLLSHKLGGTASSHILGEWPFASERRMASVLIRHEPTVRSYVRGAPETLLERSTHYQHQARRVALDEKSRQAFATLLASWAAQAMRVVALGYRDGHKMPVGPVEPTDAWESELTFIGLIGIVDPPRPEVAQAIRQAAAAGVRTVMITGDHPATARAIASEIGLWDESRGDLLLTGTEIDQLPARELESKIDRVRIVARATAENKLRIVEAFKARGLICAMTGDGVNDAPAVKAASIGVAMGKAGADVTKEAASLVLADDNYATIVSAIEEGRAIYANIKKFIFFLLTSNTGAVLFVLLAALLGWETPLAPIQILWINLITNGLPALALGVDGREPEQMAEPPRPPGGSILSKRQYLEMLGMGAIMAATAVIAFLRTLPHPHAAPTAAMLAHARTMVFCVLSVGPLFYSFHCRSERRTLIGLGIFSNRALWGAFLIGLVLQTITVYVPALRPLFKTAALSPFDLAWVFVLTIIPFHVGEVLKLIRNAMDRRVKSRS